MYKSLLLSADVLCNVLNAMAQQPPNIILILVHDLNVAGEAMGGDPQVHTANLARLASDGVHFANGYANSTVCSPPPRHAQYAAASV